MALDLCDIFASWIIFFLIIIFYWETKDRTALHPVIPVLYIVISSINKFLFQSGYYNIIWFHILGRRNYYFLSHQILSYLHTHIPTHNKRDTQKDKSDWIHSGLILQRYCEIIALLLSLVKMTLYITVLQHCPFDTHIVFHQCFPLN